MTLLTQYKALVQKGEIVDDPMQREVLISMQGLIDDKGKQTWFRKRHPLKGIYLYGSVGVGKTFLVDLFFQQLQERKKARFHFHHFMQQIDSKLRKIQGQKDPILTIAKDLSKSIRVLCFDEFLVHDVAHAMILAELLQALYHHGVILVVSSNTAPDDLYLHGIQRARFLPAIALIKKHCEIIHLDDKKDYRIGRTLEFTAYLYPLTNQNQSLMDAQFQQICNDYQQNGFIHIQNRDISYLKCGSKSIWFDFNTICNLPRSQSDYLEIAQKYNTVFLSGIPGSLEDLRVQTLLFIYLIDVLYDRGIRLVILADVPLEDLYKKEVMPEAFKRTLSRLQEMQSQDYLSRHPRRKDDGFEFFSN